MVHCIAARVTRSSPPHRAEFVNSLSLMLRARLARSQGVRKASARRAATIGARGVPLTQGGDLPVLASPRETMM